MKPVKFNLEINFPYIPEFKRRYCSFLGSIESLLLILMIFVYYMLYAKTIKSVVFKRYFPYNSKFKFRRV